MCGPSWPSPILELDYAPAERKPAVRPDLQRRLHGAEPVVGAVTLHGRSHHSRWPRHDDPGRRQQHDCGRRTAHGRDRRPPRRPHRVAPGHPARCRRRCHRVRQVAPHRLRHADHAEPDPHGRRRAGLDPQARPRRSRGRRRRWCAGRNLHRARRRRVRPLQPVEERDEQRPDGDRGRHVARRDLRPPVGSATVGGAGRRRDGAPDRMRHPQGRAAVDDLPARRSTATASCASPLRSASTATRRRRPSRCWRWAPTCW